MTCQIPHGENGDSVELRLMESMALGFFDFKMSKIKITERTVMLST